VPFLVDDDRENEYDGSPDSVHAYLPKLAHEQFDEGRQHVLVRVTGLAVQGIVEEARKQGDPKRAFSLAREAMQVVYELDFMLHPREKSAENRTWMWWHIRGGGIVPAGKENKCSIAKNEFERAAGHYVARRWMQNDYIDWCIVDALVRYEWAAYYHSITDRTPALLLGEADFKWVVRTFYAIFYSVCFGLSLCGASRTSMPSSRPGRRLPHGFSPSCQPGKSLPSYAADGDGGEPGPRTRSSRRGF
jgi:hypothetical protein